MTIDQMWQRLTAHQPYAAEREACAEICDPVDMEVEEWERLSDYRQGLSDGAETCAEAIRARIEE